MSISLTGVDVGTGTGTDTCIDDDAALAVLATGYNSCAALQSAGMCCSITRHPGLLAIGGHGVCGCSCPPSTSCTDCESSGAVDAQDVPYTCAEEADYCDDASVLRNCPETCNATTCAHLEPPAPPPADTTCTAEGSLAHDRNNDALLKFGQGTCVELKDAFQCNTINQEQYREADGMALCACSCPFVAGCVDSASSGYSNDDGVPFTCADDVMYCDGAERDEFVRVNCPDTCGTCKPNATAVPAEGTLLALVTQISTRNTMFA